MYIVPPKTQKFNRKLNIYSFHITAFNNSYFICAEIGFWYYYILNLYKYIFFYGNNHNIDSGWYRKFYKYRICRKKLYKYENVQLFIHMVSRILLYMYGLSISTIYRTLDWKGVFASNKRSNTNLHLFLYNESYKDIE